MANDGSRLRERDSSDGGNLIPFRPLVLDQNGITLIPRPAGQSEEAKKLRALADAPATLRAYAADWRHFGAWCRENGFRPLDGAEAMEGIVGEYLTAHQKQAVSTLRRRRRHHPPGPPRPPALRRQTPAHPRGPARRRQRPWA